MFDMVWKWLNISRAVNVISRYIGNLEKNDLARFEVNFCYLKETHDVVLMFAVNNVRKGKFAHLKCLDQLKIYFNSGISGATMQVC